MTTKEEKFEELRNLSDTLDSMQRLGDWAVKTAIELAGEEVSIEDAEAQSLSGIVSHLKETTVCIAKLIEIYTGEKLLDENNETLPKRLIDRPLPPLPKRGPSLLKWSIASNDQT